MNYEFEFRKQLRDSNIQLSELLKTHPDILELYLTVQKLDEDRRKQISLAIQKIEQETQKDIDILYKEMLIFVKLVNK